MSVESTANIGTMETILEQQRRYHEEKERLMDAKTKEMLHKKSTVRWSLCVSIASASVAISHGF